MMRSRSTPAWFVRCTASQRESGDHQYPSKRSISSCATNSGSPYVTPELSGFAMTRSAPDPEPPGAPISSTRISPARTSDN